MTNNIELFEKVEEVVLLLKTGDEEKASSIFNEEILPVYENVFEKDNKLEPLKLFIMELDEYINDESMKILGATTLNEIISEFLDLKRTYIK